MVKWYVRLQNFLAGLADDRGDVAIEYIAIGAIVGGGVVVAATVLRSDIAAAFTRLGHLVNGIG
jgi:Flp pilus assembly pilin Flp